MDLSTLDGVLWTTGFLGEAVLFAILMVRHRWKDFPAFTAFSGFAVMRDLLLYTIYLRYSSVWYARAYWSMALLDFALQLGVVWEIARIVLQPTGSWVLDAKRQFILWGAAGILFAVALPSLVTPPAATLLDRMEVRGNLFTSLVVCELIAVVTRTSKSLGLGWRNHVMALGNGWTAWALAAILVDGLHSYFGAQRYFTALEHVRMFVYLAVLGYWMVQFWLEEPARRPISPELRAYIEDLHRRVQNNLDSLEAQR
jgi:hypothetical protein